ncbi:MAG: MGMT family protein, partial [Actinomycetota bacterium]
QIAKGDLWTYGEVAEAAGCRNPRAVGHALKMTHREVPWHRVIPASGKLVPHLAEEQGRLLRQEGHEIANGRVVAAT